MTECVNNCKNAIPLTGEECAILIKEKLGSGWRLFYCNYNGAKQTSPNFIHKRFKFGFKFKQVRDFVTKVTDLAEEYNHHPDITFGWGYVVVKLYTHTLLNPSVIDFQMAEEIEKLNLKPVSQ